MGEVEILQRDGADVPGVGNLYLVLVALAVRPRFRPIPCFGGHGLGEDVLLFKQHLQIPLHLVQGEHPLMEGGQNGQQHIGVMLDLIQLKVVLVIVVGALVAVQVLLQFCLHLAVGGLGPGQVRVLRKIGGGHQAGGSAPKHGGTGLHQAHNQHKHQTDPAHDEKGVLVFRDKAAQLLGDGSAALLCRRGGSLGRLARGLGRAGPCPVRGGVLFLQPFLLPQAGDGIAGSKLGVLHDRLLPIEVGVGLDRRLLRPLHIPPGFQLAVCPGLVDTPAAIAHGLFDLPLPQVPRLDAGVLALHLAHLAVDRGLDLLHGLGQRVAVFLPRRFHRDSGLRRVQLVRRLVRLVDSFFQLRRRPVCLRKLQTGGRAVPGRLPLPEGVAPLAPRLFRLAAFHMARRLVHRPAQHTGGLISRGIVLLRGAV